MAKTFMQLADDAMAQAHSVSVEEALQELKDNPNALLVDVREAEEVEANGLGVGAINAPGRSLAWKACREIYEEYREPELQDPSRRVLTTCGSSRCICGKSADRNGVH
jgi:rhodanese-related sulfurtransferase